MKPIIELYDNGTWAYKEAQSSGQTPSGSVPPIEFLPPVTVNLGETNTSLPGAPAAANEVIGASFSVREPNNGRTLTAAGQPGNFSNASWAIFDRLTGARLFHGDNQPVFNGLQIDPASVLSQLAPGDYIFAVAQNLNLSKLGFYWLQN